MLNTKQFTRSRGSKIFVAEDSDLGGNYLVRIFPDSYDPGFELMSSETRRVVKFYRTRTKRDGEGEVTVWIYEPTPDEIRRDRSLLDVEVHILND